MRDYQNPPPKSSKYVGVFWERLGQRWRVHTGGGGNVMKHGRYLTEREAALARNQAMIARFGYDPAPNVITEPGPEVLRFSSAGQPELMIRKLAVMKDKGGGILCLCCLPGETLIRLRGRTQKLHTLLLDQPYIRELIFAEGNPAQIDLDSAPMPAISGPWITIPKPLPSAEVLIHWRQGSGPRAGGAWKKLVDENEPQAGFLGSALQQQIFRTHTSCRKMKVFAPKNYNHAAKMLAGCRRLYSNPSAISDIALGMGAFPSVIVESDGEMTRFDFPADQPFGIIPPDSGKVSTDVP